MAGDAVDQRAARLKDESTAPVSESPAAPEQLAADEEMPRVTLTRRRLIGSIVFVLAVFAFLYFGLPQISGVGETWSRVGQGDHAWLAAALVFEVLSIAGYLAIFMGVNVPRGSVISWRDSYLITMAGLAATRLFAAAGAGGVALTAWALRRSGMEAREVAERMIAFLVMMYGIYTAAMLVCGLGLRLGVFPGNAPFGVTVVPAIISAVAMTIVLSLALVPEDLEQRIERMAFRRPRAARWARRIALGPASMRGGVRMALHKAIHPDRALAGVFAWWAFNIAVLWAAFHAFGDAPPAAVLIQGYFVGMLGNLLPLPGGVGGVDGGMIAAFAAFGVDAGLALLAVLTYRLFAFWLPTLPGIVAYLQLRKRVQQWRSAPAVV